MKKIRGRKITYSVQAMHLPNGVIASMDVIEHPGAALMIPFLAKNKIIFLRQYRAIFKEYLYELPAGTLDPKEKVISCARRELIEETGYRAKLFRKLGHIYVVPGYSNEVIHIFEARGLVPAEAPKDIDEILKPIILTKSKVQQLFRQRKIVDAKSICALAMCGWI